MHPIIDTKSDRNGDRLHPEHLPAPSGAMDGALAVLVFLLMMLGVALVMSARLALKSPPQRQSERPGA